MNRKFDINAYNNHKAINEKPRKGSDGDMPGSYNLAFRVFKQTINPGDNITFELYITGYGSIFGNKLVFYPPPNFITEGTVEVGYTAMLLDNGELNFKFGGNTIDLDSGRKAMFTLNLTGLNFIDGNEISKTLFFDMFDNPDNLPTQIATEVRSITIPENEKNTYKDDSKELEEVSPPFYFNLSTDKNLSPGNHSLQLFFTYFNGVEWKTSIGNLTVRVRPRHERHQYIFMALGILLAFAALFPSIYLIFVDDTKINEVVKSLRDINSTILDSRENIHFDRDLDW